MPDWNDLSETFGLDVVNYFTEMGERMPITQFVPRRCHWCGDYSSSLSPDGSGDWWFFCSSCGAFWNLFEHLRRTTGLPEQLAVKWLVSSRVLNQNDAIRYANISGRKSIVTEWLRGLLLKSERPQTDVPGELFSCHSSDIVDIAQKLGEDVPSWIVNGRFLVGSIDRSIYGIPCKISFSFGSATKAKNRFKISLSKDQQNVEFVDGIISGNPLYLITPEFLLESKDLPTERPLAIVRQNLHLAPRFYSTPPHINLRLLSSDGRIKGDLVGAPFILESSTSKVVINSREIPVDQVLMESGWWMGITGFALGKGAISRSALHRIACLGAAKTGDSIAKVEEAIRSCSGVIAESIRTPTLIPSPSGIISRDGEDKGIKVSPYRYWGGVVANFNVARLSSDDDSNVRLSLTIEGKRAVLEVPQMIADDSNLLITELHAAARENNMGALVVYRCPPYPKNLFYK